MTRRALVSSLVVLFLAAPAVVLAQTEVNTCGQVLTGAGYLAADLNCSGFQDPITVPGYQFPWGPTAVVIANGGSLDLRGHTIDCGGSSGPLYGVACITKKCSISNGTITNAGAHGITSNTKKRVTIQSMTVTNSGEEGVYVSSALIIDSTISDNAGEGVSVIGRAKLIRSTVTGSGEEGIAAPRVILIDSTVTGNGTIGTCGACSQPCPDLSIWHKPRLRDSTCGTSLNASLRDCRAPWRTWHLCTDD